MIVIDPNSECNNAKPYYYNYLSGDIKDIPQSIYAHIKQCSYCQQEVKSLKIILATNKTYSKESLGKTDAVIAEGLKLHFAYEGKYVTCRNVKPFLPSLADPFLEIRMPTPITTHIDNCPKCTEELDTIRQLNLSHKQWCKSGQLFAERPPESSELCEKAREAIPAVVSISFNKTTGEILKHLCVCPDCRRLIYKRREQVIKGLLSSNIASKKFPCEAVSDSDIFDYCFPYGINPDNDEYIKFRPSFISHVSVCPECLNKLQQLHKTLSGIMEEEESNIITSYKITDDKTSEKKVIPDNIYSDWPIKVEVFDKSCLEETSSVTYKKEAKPKRLKAIRFAKLMSAAAVILIIIVLSFLNPIVKAVDLGQIYNALGKLKNIYIATYSADESKIIQEKWVSSTLNTMMFKTGSQNVLLDINSKSRKTVELNTRTPQTVELDQQAIIGAQESMKAPWGLLPFNDISAAPKDSWIKVEDDISKSTVLNTEVYDLIWKEELSDGTIIYKKWRGYIDKETILPKRIEMWEKLAENNEYEPTVVIKIDYPSTNEIQQKIKDLGFE